MNKKTVVLVVLLAVLAIPLASADPVPVLHFKPTDSTVSGGYPDSTNVGVWVNTSQCVGSTGIASFAVAVSYDPSCVNITSVTSTAGWSVWSWSGDPQSGTPDAGGPGVVWLTAVSFMGDLTGDFEAFNLTIDCTDCSRTCCKTLLNFTDGTDPVAYPLWITNLSGRRLLPVLENGTVTCGLVVAEDFSKPLYEGWNLISLPLVSDDSSASTVLSTVSYDAVYRYNATSKQFDSAAVMNPGTGYFVHATEDCTWEYSGTAYGSMSTLLEPGLNMVGWLNCSKAVDTLSSISGDCYYVAQWNTAAEKFEVYNPSAPSAAFNDFTAMDRGTGYFISAKQDCVLSENC